MPIPLDAISMVSGLVGGFLMKTVAESRKNRQEERLANIKRGQEADASADKAFKRIPADAGKWNRRVIMVCVLLGVILFPAVAAFVNTPVITEVVVDKPILWGLFGTKTQHMFVELQGYLISQDLKYAFEVLIGAYFGQSFAK